MWFTINIIHYKVIKKPNVKIPGIRLWVDEPRTKQSTALFQVEFDSRLEKREEIAVGRAENGQCV